jgi:hypothetical protein
VRLQAARLGDAGFLAFVHRLAELGVLDREERLRWVSLHAAVLWATDPPIDTGNGVSDDLVPQLLRKSGE